MTETEIDQFVLAVEQRLRGEIARTPAAAPARALLDAGGKRLRVRLLWWSAQATASAAVAPDDDALVRAAAAIEFAHLGSLIHDDIADRSDTRRGVPTIHLSHGVAIAVDAGTALAHLASELAATLGYPARQAVRRAILGACRGQIRELAVPFVLVSPRVRLAIMQEKTGAFFDLAATLGAVIGGAPRPHLAAVRRFARRFGVAFQIADDVLDLTGDPRELGRANGADLREGVPTLPLLLADDTRHTLSDALARVRVDPSSEAIAACAHLIERGGGIAAAEAAAQWWLQRSLRDLEELPASPALTPLRDLARTAVARGLRRGGSATYVGDSVASLMAFEARSAWEESIGTSQPTVDSIGDASLARLLTWFHPGLSGLIARLAVEPAILYSRNRAQRQLLRDDSWSRESLRASEAIALAYAIAQHALRIDPPRTLALVDALYCAAIGELCRALNPREHEQMAARARTLLLHPSVATAPRAPSMSHMDSQDGVSLSA